MMCPAVVSVRGELPADYDAVHKLVRLAFNDEDTAELVRRIRASVNYLPELSLVADSASEVVGHVMFSHVELDDGATHHEVLTLSPLSVLPAAQRQGIGSALIRAGIQRADEQDEPLIVLEGSPALHPRFGFEPAKAYGITIHLPSWAPDEAAMVRPLSRYRPDIRGAVRYPPAFDVVNADR
jgi:putative acetyltransferase